MKPLAALDEFFLLDNDKNRANIIVVIKTDRVRDYETLRKQIIDLAIVNDRCKHSLTKFMGEFFFEEIPAHRLENALANAYIRNDSIKTDEDIAEFIATEQMIREPLDQL